LEYIKESRSWAELKNEFLNEFHPTGYSVVLKTKLENCKQEVTESLMSFVTDIENLYRQVERNLKEKDICTYISKGLKEPVFNAISLHDNRSLIKIIENLKKFKLMQFRINSKGHTGFTEYTDILNKQISQVGKYSMDQVEELSAKIDQLSNSVKKVNFKNNSTYRENSYDRNSNRSFRHNSRNREVREDHHKYRNNSPYPNSSNYRNRELSAKQINRYNRNNGFDRNFNNQNDSFDNSHVPLKSNATILKWDIISTLIKFIFQNSQIKIIMCLPSEKEKD